MLCKSIWKFGLLALAAAQSTSSSSPATDVSSPTSSSASASSSSSSSSSSTSGYSGTPRGSITDIPNNSRATYITYSSTRTVTTTSRPAYGSMSSSSGTIMTGNATRSSNATMTSSSSSTSSSQIVLGGTVRASSASGNGTQTSTTATAPSSTNTTPCNNHPEFCNRKYSNITGVAAHNSPFVVPGNAASNQAYGTIAQLNDGIRLLQTETHWPNDTVYLCHSSCDILNVGSLESWLRSITQWVQAHPYDVVTLLIGNQDYQDVSRYVAPFQNSGITQYVYTPPKVPMALGDWPTLAQMIVSQQRVVVFMDYDADQTTVPWILDEFSQMWETPFNPTNNSFPCTIQRPPGLNVADAENRLYLLNNNLNTEITLAGMSLLIPTTTLLNVTNAANGTGSLGESTKGCVQDWNRPPNWLDVDYYNVGGGSVFEVAAKWNNVTYNRPCCGTDTSITSAATMLDVMGRLWLSVAAFVVAACWLMM